MKKIILTFCLLACMTLTALAQQTITGTIVDRDTKEGVMQATVALLKKDSTFVKGVISSTNGQFTMTAPAAGNYLLKVTSVAYKTLVKPITVTKGKALQLGNVVLAADAIMLKEAIATGQASKVTVKEDTFVYNAAAYRTPEGSVIEELVKRLPGAQVDDDGKIKINGKEVKKILVDGKEFMTGDTETALKNLPTDIIDKIKAYDQKSDLSRVTGIDDGEEETVLDFGIKRGMNKGYMINGDLSLGTQNRYSDRMMAAYMQDNTRIMGFGSANNTGDRGFPGGGGGRWWGGGNNGLNASKMLGLNLNYEKKNVIKIDGSVRWNYSGNDTWSRTSSESFLAENKSFSNSLSQSFQRRLQWNAQMRLEWTPDTMTNIMFRPRLSLSTTDKTSLSQNATYNDDPYLYVEDPLNDEAIKKLDEMDKIVNGKRSSSLSYTKNNSASGMLQYNRKLNTKGRNITLRLDGSISDGDSKSLSLQDVTLYQMLSILGTDSTYQTNRYNLTPTKNKSYTLKGTYSEPLGKGFFAQLSYSYKYSMNTSDRSTYDFSRFGKFDMSMPEYNSFDRYLSQIGSLDPYLDKNLSRYSEYNNYTHEGEVQLRKIGAKWNYNVGFMVQPQRSHFVQDYQGVHTDTTRNVVNYTPSLDLRYKISKVSQLRMTYRGSTSQPSMTDLLDITDDSDPLNISKGNPGLKPSFTQNFRLFYNGFRQWHTQSWMTFLNFSFTENSISSMVTYNAETGGRVTRPENINGNWNAGWGGMFNTSIDSTGVWNINTFTGLNYQNHVSYLFQNNETMKNTTRSTSVSERLAFSYRGSWLEVEPNAMVNYTHTRNLLQSQNNLDTWNFNYGMNITITAPWGTGFSTDAHMNSRRGYNDSNLNTNEFVWNAQISQSFLKGRPLTISLQFYDILKNQSTLSRQISATGRTDSEYNNINSYVMLHAIFRINKFGGKGNKGGMGGPGGPGGPDFGRPDFRRPGGGFGGGRPRF